MYFQGMNISFTKQQEEYISDQLASGDFRNASEVVRDALRLHKYYRQKVLDDLRKEMIKGWDGESSTLSATEIARAKYDQIKSK